MLNLDSEDFGVITVGCAGGGDTKIELPIKTQVITGSNDPVHIKITGLRGGHSGIDIHEQRGNAIKILTRLLWNASKTYEFYLSAIHGGDKHNAIPREATATVSINKSQKNNFLSALKAEVGNIKNEIAAIDPKLKLDITEGDTVEKSLDKHSQSMLLNLLHGLPHGVQKMSYDIPNLVETSTNLATVSLQETKVMIGMSSRSSVQSALDDMRNRIHAIAILCGGKVQEDTPYPGWKPNLDSSILAIAKNTFKDIYGKDPKVEAIHAGLECGIIGERFPGMDMISIGPTIKYPHSPEEKVYIDTVEKFYDYVLKILENL
jgi:dipeptidase D